MDEFLDIVADVQNAVLLENVFYEIWKDHANTMSLYGSEKWNEIYDKYFSRLPKSDGLNAGNRNIVSPFRKKKKFVFIKIAASVFIAALCSITTYYFIKRDNLAADKKEEPQTVKAVPIIKPGGNNAVLTLSNGQQFNLNKVAVGNITRQQNVYVSKTKDGQIIFKYDSSVKSDRLAVASTLNNISTPKGGKYQIDLPDGTRVWLNAMSSLSFPAAFTGGERSVKLRGEAYFEVAKNPSMPFIVESGNQKVKVLGTHFNISAYDEEVFKTTLLEGKVEVSSGDKKVVIKPGQQTSLSGSNIKIAYVDPEEAIDWKNGYIDFNNENIYDIMRKIGRWYDVDIQYQGAVSKVKLGGSVSRNENISKILTVLEATGIVHFKIDKRRIIVMP